MIFVLTMLFTFVYDGKNEYHWHYSLFITITHCSEYKHPTFNINFVVGTARLQYTGCIKKNEVQL